MEWLIEVLVGQIWGGYATARGVGAAGYGGAIGTRAAPSGLSRVVEGVKTVFGGKKAVGGMGLEEFFEVGAYKASYTREILKLFKKMAGTPKGGGVGGGGGFGKLLAGLGIGGLTAGTLGIGALITAAIGSIVGLAGYGAYKGVKRAGDIFGGEPTGGQKVAAGFGGAVNALSAGLLSTDFVAKFSYNLAKSIGDYLLKMFDDLKTIFDFVIGFFKPLVTSKTVLGGILNPVSTLKKSFSTVASGVKGFFSKDKGVTPSIGTESVSVDDEAAGAEYAEQVPSEQFISSSVKLSDSSINKLALAVQSQAPSASVEPPKKTISIGTGNFKDDVRSNGDIVVDGINRVAFSLR